MRKACEAPLHTFNHHAKQGPPLLVALLISLACTSRALDQRYHLEKTDHSELFRVLPAGHVGSRGLLGGWSDDKTYIAICACVRDELAENLVEWVQYHALLGVGRFLLFDYNSSQPVFTALEAFARRGLVDVYFHASHHRGRGGGYADSSQGFAYQQCIRVGKTRHRWIAFIDTDEYIFVKGSTCPSLPAILPSFSSFPALGLNWVFFGSSGHNTRPTAGALNSYSKCLPSKHGVCEHVKSIVNTKYVEGLDWSSHHFTYTNGAKAVNENKVPFDGPWSRPASHNRLMLHHYFSRSREEFEQKTLRGAADGQPSKNMGDYERYNAAATENCTDGLSFWPRCCGGSNLTEATRWLCSGVARFALQAASGGAGAGGAGKATAGAVKPAMLRL